MHTVGERWAFPVARSQSGHDLQRTPRDTSCEVPLRTPHGQKAISPTEGAKEAIWDFFGRHVEKFHAALAPPQLQTVSGRPMSLSRSNPRAPASSARSKSHICSAVLSPILYAPTLHICTQVPPRPAKADPLKSRPPVSSDEIPRTHPLKGII